MYQFQQFCASSDFQDFLHHLLNTDEGGDYIHGVFIDYHPSWLRMARDEANIGELNLPKERYLDHYVLGGMKNNDAEYLASQNYNGNWHTEAEKKHKSLCPFLIKVHVKPFTSLGFSFKSRLELFLKKSNYFGQIVESHIPVLCGHAESGSMIHDNGNGTIGGILHDRNGDVYATTCGHVSPNIGSSVSIDDLNGVLTPQSASVKYSSFPGMSINHSNRLCNPYAGDVQTTTNDAALLTLSKKVNYSNTIKNSNGVINKIYDRTRLSSGDSVVMAGASSGHHEYIIGGYGVTTKIKIAGTSDFYCFSNVFEINAPTPRAGFLSRAGQMIMHKPLPGDSGAWICFEYDSDEYAYFGNLVGVNGMTGIATFADSLITWGKSACQLDLSIYV